MSPLELLGPDTVETVPFSVRLAERRLSDRAAAVRSDRRAHLRRNASDLDWLRSVRLLGGSGYDVKLVDLSEGGALLEVDAPLRPGLTLTLEMTGPELDAAVPIEVLRCYIANLRGETTIYRGACAFAHLIELPGRNVVRAPAPAGAANFVGTDAALTFLLERCTPSSPGGTNSVTLERTDVLHVLDALQMRTSARGSDLLSRHTSDLLAAIIPALRDRAPREITVGALEERLRGVPQQWRTQLQPTSGRLMSLIEHFVTAVDTNATPPPSEAAPPEVAGGTVDAFGSQANTAPLESGEQAKSAFQRIVVRHADGQIVKGYSQDFHPSRPQFSLWPSIHSTMKERIVVEVARLKAVFFVRDFNGNPRHQERKTFGAARGQGRRVEVTFSDGEVVLGTTLNYRPDGQGFFVSPADPASNNTRVFVVATALKRVRFL